MEYFEYSHVNDNKVLFSLKNKYTFIMKKIAVVGVGIMGAGIAMNYLKNGYEVYVWNRGKEKLVPLIEKGAKVVASPKEAAEKADIVFEVTANDESSRAVWLGSEGILAGARKGQTLISSATLSVSWVDELATLCVRDGFTYLDITLTGGRMAAEAGTLLMLAGGNEKEFEEILPDLSAVSSKVIRFGNVGAGARYKLILNMLQAIHIEGLGEALKLAEKAGMDVKKVGDALVEHPGGVLTERTWKFHQNPPNPITFSVQWIDKDLHYAHQLGDSLDLPLLEGVIKKYDEAMSKGMQEEDWSSITKI